MATEDEVRTATIEISSPYLAAFLRSNAVCLGWTRRDKIVTFFALREKRTMDLIESYYAGASVPARRFSKEDGR